MSSIAIRGKNKGADGLVTTTTLGTNEGLNINDTALQGLKVIVDEASATVTYIGKAPMGSATSASVWLIEKVDTTSGTIITWAGTGGFDQEWDERAAATYS